MPLLPPPKNEHTAGSMSAQTPSPSPPRIPEPRTIRKGKEPLSPLLAAAMTATTGTGKHKLLLGLHTTVPTMRAARLTGTPVPLLNRTDALPELVHRLFQNLPAKPVDPKRPQSPLGQSLLSRRDRVLAEKCVHGRMGAHHPPRDPLLIGSRFVFNSPPRA
jgi:hypothetical protein